MALSKDPNEDITIPFFQACLAGDFTTVESFINDMKNIVEMQKRLSPDGTARQSLAEGLECRFTLLRQTPLMVVLIGYATIQTGYVYVYVCMNVCVCVSIYIYIIHRWFISKTDKNNNQC